MTHNRKVDVDIAARVMRAAKARLVLVNELEVKATGIARTVLADVGRRIILNWSPPSEPPGDVDSRGYRRANPWGRVGRQCQSTNKSTGERCRKAARAGRLVCNLHDDGTPELAFNPGSLSLTPFRFSINDELYKQRSAEMKRHNVTVTRALEEGLVTFARTGQL